jgi:hypothetical protein
MKIRIIEELKKYMKPYLNKEQSVELTKVLFRCLNSAKISEKNIDFNMIDFKRNEKLLSMFIVAKKVEGLFTENFDLL